MRIGRIYKIIPREGSEVYIGSTFNTVSDRFKNHRSDFKKYLKNKEKNRITVHYIFQKYGVDNCVAVLIKEYEVEDRRHLSVYELLWIKKLGAINKNEPCGTLLLKEQVRQLQKKKKVENPELIKQQKRLFYLKHIEKYKDYYARNKGRIKAYQEINKEKYQEYKRTYNEKHR
jgi:Uri superfamily endonuclease